MHIGVEYVKAVELPGATMVISDSNVAIEDSVFSGLSFFGQGALVLANSNVTFVNVTFSACNNSAGASSLLHGPARSPLALCMQPLLRVLDRVSGWPAAMQCRVVLPCGPRQDCLVVAAFVRCMYTRELAMGPIIRSPGRLQ